MEPDCVRRPDAMRPPAADLDRQLELPLELASPHRAADLQIGGHGTVRDELVDVSRLTNQKSREPRSESADVGQINVARMLWQNQRSPKFPDQLLARNRS